MTTMLREAGIEDFLKRLGIQADDDFQPRLVNDEVRTFLAKLGLRVSDGDDDPLAIWKFNEEGLHEYSNFERELVEREMRLHEREVELARREEALAERERAMSVENLQISDDDIQSIVMGEGFFRRAWNRLKRVVFPVKETKPPLVIRPPMASPLVKPCRAKPTHWSRGER